MSGEEQHRNGRRGELRVEGGRKEERPQRQEDHKEDGLCIVVARGGPVAFERDIGPPTAA